MTPFEKAEEIWLYFDQQPKLKYEEIKAYSLFVANELYIHNSDPSKNDFWIDVIKCLEVGGNIKNDLD